MQLPWACSGSFNVIGITPGGSTLSIDLLSYLKHLKSKELDGKVPFVNPQPLKLYTKLSAKANPRRG